MDKPEKAPMRLTIKTNEDCLEIEAPTGTNLADALTDAGLSINFACGGHGSCGCCGVHVRSGSFMLGGNPVVIDGQDTLPSCRIICDEGVAQIDVPASAIVLSRGRILENYNLPSHTFSPTVRIEQEQNGETTTRLLRMLTDKGWRQTPLRDEASAVPLGIAVDIGTTTVAAVMLDLATGNILSRASLYNQQIQKADDVASRISFCRDDEAVEQMRKLIVDDTISVLIDDLCRDAGAASDRVLRIAFSGNTTMMHLLAGLNPTSMGSLPFTPVATQFPTQSASKLGFPVHSEAVADLLPSSAAYIGADIVSDLLVSSLTQGPKPALLVDIGTNGEIVLAADGNLFACATAAGPAFEGAGLSHGCRAAQGAICHICFDDQLDLRIEVIGGGEPLGICGSAVVDFLACGRRSGLLNEFGRFDKDKLEECGRLTEVQTDHGNSMACLLAERTQDTRGPVSLSEADIAQALKAKAAIQAGIQTLLEACNSSEDDLRRLVIAGGFGHYVDLENATAIGLLPSVAKDRIEVIGNGSLAGAALCMLDESASPALHRYAAEPEIVELNRIASFEDYFIDSLLLPELTPLR